MAQLFNCCCYSSTMLPMLTQGLFQTSKWVLKVTYQRSDLGWPVRDLGTMGAIFVAPLPLGLVLVPVGDILKYNTIESNSISVKWCPTCTVVVMSICPRCLARRLGCTHAVPCPPRRGWSQVVTAAPARTAAGLTPQAVTAAANRPAAQWMSWNPSCCGNHSLHSRWRRQEGLWRRWWRGFGGFSACRRSRECVGIWSRRRRGQGLHWDEQIGNPG